MTPNNDNQKSSEDRNHYWVSPVPDLDDLGNSIHDEFIDGRIRGHRAWCLTVPEAHKQVGAGLGLGQGKHYKKQEDGRWLKIAG